MTGLLWRVLGPVAAFVLVAGGIYAWAYNNAREAAALREARAEIETLRREYQAQEALINAARQAAQDNERTAREAQERLDDYAKELAARGDAVACRLDARDLRRLHSRRAKPAPAAR